MPRADHKDDLGLVAVLHRLQRRSDISILIRRTTREQEGARDSDSLLSYLVIRVFKWMQCLNGVAVGGNGEVMELVL